MFSYLGYGLQIRSEFQLPGFVVGERHDLPEVRVIRRHVPLDQWSELNDDGLKLAGVARGVMRFQVKGGEQIVVDPEPDADLDYARAIISGELMAALLRQRGLLTLHGSCVAKDGRAIGFVGHSGWGKSTLAMHFVANGYRLLCDDVLAVAFTDKGPAAVPGYPQVKLRPDSGALFVKDNIYETLPSAHTETDKRLYGRADYFQEVPVPLRKLYLLEGRTRPDNKVLPVAEQQAFGELLRHTRATNLLKNPTFLQVHLHQLKDLLEGVPVSLLHRRMSLDLLPELLDAIELDLSPKGFGSDVPLEA